MYLDKLMTQDPRAKAEIRSALRRVRSGKCKPRMLTRMRQRLINATYHKEAV
jgi:hypothetical protein